MGTILVLDFIWIMCTLQNNYIAKKIQPCAKKSSLSWDTIILQETLIVHKKVVPSLLIKKQLYCKKAVMKLTITMNKKVNIARRVDG